MDTFIFIIRIILLILGSLATVIYVLLQLFQKTPLSYFKVSTPDYIFYLVISLLFGFGTNSYYGLLSFVPLYGLKVMVRILMERWYSGFWMAVSWKKLLPKGFERDLPRQALAEMARIPNSVDFIIPKVYLSIGVYFMLKNIKKQSGLAPGGFSSHQQQVAQMKLQEIVQGFSTLKPLETKSHTLPFGLIKVRRY
jgi:hypothetical protein